MLDDVGDGVGERRKERTIFGVLSFLAIGRGGPGVRRALRFRWSWMIEFFEKGWKVSGHRNIDETAIVIPI